MVLKVYLIIERFSYDLKKWFPQVFVIFFISQWMERTKHGLFVFPPKKTLIWRRHCSIDQSCCSMTSKQFLESSLGMEFVYPSVRLTNQKPGAFVSVRYTNQIALFPFVCCFCFVRAFSFQGHTKIALFLVVIRLIYVTLKSIKTKQKTQLSVWCFFMVPII